MLHLLSIEFNKVRNYRTFWVMLGIYAILVPLGIYAVSTIEFPLFKGGTLLEFPATWNFVTYMASWFNLLLGILVVLIVCNDFNYRTFKQNVIDGLSKNQVILSKFLLILAIAIAVTIYTFLLGLIFGSIHSESGDFLEEIHYVGIYFIQTIGYFTLAFLIAILLKRPALSIIIFALMFILKFIFYLSLGEELSQYFPVNLISDLTPFPMQHLIELLKMNPDPTAQAEAQAKLDALISQSVRTTFAVIYIALFVFLSNLILKKRDL